MYPDYRGLTVAFPLTFNLDVLDFYIISTGASPYNQTKRCWWLVKYSILLYRLCEHDFRYAQIQSSVETN